MPAPPTRRSTSPSAPQTRTEVLRDPRMLFAFEAEVASAAIAAGLTEAPAPAMSHADSIGNNQVLDAWRAEVGYVTFAERPETNRRLPGTLPRGLPPMPSGRLPGLDRDLSKLILGCDNKADLASGALIWDAFVEAGGTTFDTAFVYGGGKFEAVFGDWLRARGMAGQVTTIVKGAHTPYNLPQAIAPQLAISLERLGLESAPVYIMHRDNPEVPVGEFVTALNAEVAAGRIGVFGGSNWAPARIAEANAWAVDHGMQGFAVLNNNLSLAVMERPVWAGLHFVQHAGNAGISATIRGLRICPGRARRAAISCPPPCATGCPRTPGPRPASDRPPTPSVAAAPRYSPPARGSRRTRWLWPGCWRRRSRPSRWWARGRWVNWRRP